MNLSQLLDEERTKLRFDETQIVDVPRRSVQHRKYSTSISALQSESPDYLKRSIGSVFLCFIWGLLALRASTKVRKCNSVRDFSKAKYYSNIAKSHNRSAIACFLVLLFIVVFPLAVSLLRPIANVSKYLNARHYFG